MPQVVDSSNLVQLVTTGQVPEFKPPEAPKPETKPDAPTGAKTEDAPKPGGEAKAAEGAAKAEPDKVEQARDEKGQFTKAEDSKGEKPKASDDDDDADLPERVRRQIGKKHRRMMEAEEFARERDADAVRERSRADAAERELERIRGSKSGDRKSVV